MTHRLEEPSNPHNPSISPLTASLHYRCGCANNEVLVLRVVLLSTLNEEEFVWTMKAAWRDMQTEIRQHLEK